MKEKQPNTRIAIMPLDEVLNFCTQMEDANVRVWLDGGWGVDALLGGQTRDHSDLDIAVEAKNLAKLRDILREQGYSIVPDRDEKPWNFVLGSVEGYELDEDDYHDVKALCDHFGIPLPSEYEKFEAN